MSEDRPKVLVVEDEEQLRLLLRLTLDLGTVDIIEAGDGETAIRRARRESPDLIFLDWTLPGKTGIEVCRELRAAGDPATRNVRIVMLTGRAHDDERRQGLDAGADDYLTKPFSPQQLLDKLSEMLSRPAALRTA